MARVLSSELMRPDHPAITDVWQKFSPPANRRVQPVAKEEEQQVSAESPEPSALKSEEGTDTN